MSDYMINVIGALLYLLLAPLLGGLLSGLDRKISARMQRRVGPPLLQPFYDFGKLWDKQPIAVNKAEDSMYSVSFSSSFCPAPSSLQGATFCWWSSP